MVLLCFARQGSGIKDLPALRAASRVAVPRVVSSLSTVLVAKRIAGTGAPIIVVTIAISTSAIRFDLLWWDAKTFDVAKISSPVTKIHKSDNHE